MLVLVDCGVATRDVSAGIATRDVSAGVATRDVSAGVAREAAGDIREVVSDGVDR